MKVINVAKDFTRFPSGRKKDRGSTSGEAFSEQFILPALKNNERITIELDGTIGYGSSFLEEAFGGAIRKTGATVREFYSLVKLVSADSILLKEIDRYVREAAQRIVPA